MNKQFLFFLTFTGLILLGGAGCEQSLPLLAVPVEITPAADNSQTQPTKPVSEVLPPKIEVKKPAEVKAQSPEKLTLPARVELPVPFTSQAPFGDWRNPFGTACEKAAAFMVDAYYKGQKSITKEDARDNILLLEKWENFQIGAKIETTIAETADMINAFFPWEVILVENPTLEDIKAELSAGRPVIVPAAGKILKNPNFKNGGPDYHVFVLSGYDDAARMFTAQEPGTRNGRNYKYPYATVMDAMHDMVPNKKTITGKKVALFTHTDIRDTGNTDGDADGVTKAEEIARVTSLMDNGTSTSPAQLIVPSDVKPQSESLSSTQSDPSLPLEHLTPASEPKKVSLAVPFSSQAPFGDWSEPWGSACEETTALMIDAYYSDTGLSKEQARDGILGLVEWENVYLGYNKDTNAAETAKMINAFFPWETTIVENPKLEDLKAEINAGRPVIIPAAGKRLRNPNFRNGGPDYHVLLLHGYDDAAKTFIANDPGTSHGLDYRYSYDTIMDAIHDMVPGRDPMTGRQAVIFTHRDIRASGNTDGDNDGWTKAEELEKGTSLMERN